MQTFLSEIAKGMLQNCMFLFNIERGGTSQREGKSRADQTRARNTCTERGGSSPSKKKGENIKNVW